MGKDIPFIEFAYNRVVDSITSHSPFEIMYGFNPLTLTPSESKGNDV